MQEVRGFILAIVKELECEETSAVAHAFLLIMDFGGQGREWRALKKAWQGGVVDWDSEPLALLLAHGASVTEAKAGAFVRAAVESGLLVLQMQKDLVGIACPIFQQYNPHLLPGYVSFHKKGQQAARRKRDGAQDPELARQQYGLLRTQANFDFGELGADIGQDEIQSAIMVIMRIDRAGGLPVRSSTQYAPWMISATVRLMRTQVSDAIQKLLDFLFEARMDPTVPKGAENVLNGMESARLLERSQY